MKKVNINDIWVLVSLVLSLVLLIGFLGYVGLGYRYRFSEFPF